MVRIRTLSIGLVVALVGAAVLAAGAAGSAKRSAVAALTGTDGPTFTITLKRGSKRVKTLKAGKYKLVVKDKSNIHNFHLKGPGVNKKTGVGFVGTQTWRVKLKKGKYTYVCDPHATTMHGSFTVK